MQPSLLRLTLSVMLVSSVKLPAAQADLGVETSVTSPAAAVVEACASPEVRKLLAGYESLRITVGFIQDWSVWMVEFFDDDRRVAFATVSVAGELKEIGLGGMEPADFSGESETRRRELQRELEAARRANNEAEIREVLELLDRLDAGGNPEGRRADVTPRTPDESTLPVYGLTLPEGDLRRMLADVTEDIEVRGEMDFKGRSYPVEVRLRGASTRHAAKKSYRVRFLEETPLSRKVTYLKAEAMDHTMQQEKLSCDVLRAAGVCVSDADYINLFLNGRYEGVYLDIEPIRSPFKRKPGLDPKSTLIRAGTFQHLVGRGALGELRGDEGSLDELKQFLWQLNRVDRGDFEAFVRTQTDWPRLRDYLAVQVLCHRTEIEADDYFYYRDGESGRWSLIPWDHNNGNWAVRPYGNRVSEPAVPLFVQTIQDVGWRPNHWFVLPSRIFNNAPLRREFLARLEQLTRDLLLSGKVNQLIEVNYRQLLPEYPHDPYRVDWGKADPFLRSDRDLKAFVQRHGKRLLTLIQDARSQVGSPLLLNEVAFGEDSGWVELFNQSQGPIELSNYFLATKTAKGNHEYPLAASTVVPPGGFEVIRVPRWSDQMPGRSVDEAEGNTQGPWSFPGFDPEGGFIALVKTTTSTSAIEREERAESVQDFAFYGHQVRGKSYGRLRGGFSRLEPTPGKENVRTW